MSRDIVQFVPLREFHSRSGANFSLARETLAEIPTQLTSFMRSKGIKPNPPPLRRRQDTITQGPPGKDILHQLCSVCKCPCPCSPPAICSSSVTTIISLYTTILSSKHPHANSVPNEPTCSWTPVLSHCAAAQSKPSPTPSLLIIKFCPRRGTLSLLVNV